MFLGQYLEIQPPSIGRASIIVMWAHDLRLRILDITQLIIKIILWYLQNRHRSGVMTIMKKKLPKRKIFIQLGDNQNIRLSSRYDQKRSTTQHIRVKTLKTQNKENHQSNIHLRNNLKARNPEIIYSKFQKITDVNPFYFTHNNSLSY